MTSLRLVSSRAGVLRFLLFFGVALGWALTTQHAWEDYYITYRASKNLATGQGLTFTAGERIHSFTSPLGVLLPAVASLAVGNRSDEAALWIFRLMSITAYAGAGVLFWKTARRLNWGTPAALLLAALIATDTKIVDFSTNGMETAFLLLFFSWTLAEILEPNPRVVRLGMAWAGLMWTRPDACIYIAVVAFATLLFTGGRALRPRLELLKSYAIAAVVTTALYGPWLLWAKGYYGSPIPHTIVAKGLFGEPVTLRLLAQWLVHFPATLARHHEFLGTVFMPPYSYHTGWAEWASQASFWLCVPIMVVWLLPFAAREARIASFGFCVGIFYLVQLVRFPVPWYLPLPTALAMFVIAALANQAEVALTRGSLAGGMVALARKARVLVWALASVLLVATSTVFALAAFELRTQQRLIEEGVRTDIGRWLHDHARSSRDTVFLEPLGYIGFYSGLKMLDFPGLSSREVVFARKRATLRNYPGCWHQLILDLKPDWLVLRPYEAAEIRQGEPTLLTDKYQLERKWDARPLIAAIPFLPGRGYLTNDAQFEVYRRVPGWPVLDGAPVRSTLVSEDMFEVNQTLSGPTRQAGVSFLAHAPSRLVVSKPVGARWFTGRFWIEAGAYNQPAESHDYTDGAEFTIRYLRPDGSARELLRRWLNPRQESAARGSQTFKFELPAREAGKIELLVSPGPANNAAFDWASWGDLEFLTPE